MSTKANCILLNTRGKHYYAEEFGKFIEIKEWEYDRIVNNPHLYYFSTALEKHFEWCAAVGKARTFRRVEIGTEATTVGARKFNGPDDQRAAN